MVPAGAKWPLRAGVGEWRVGLADGRRGTAVFANCESGLPWGDWGRVGEGVGFPDERLIAGGAA